MQKTASKSLNKWLDIKIHGRTLTPNNMFTKIIIHQVTHIIKYKYKYYLNCKIKIIITLMIFLKNPQAYFEILDLKLEHQLWTPNTQHTTLNPKTWELGFNACPGIPPLVYILFMDVSFGFCVNIPIRWYTLGPYRKIQK